MIKILFALLYFLLNVLAFSQDFDNMKMGIGSATSTLTDFYCEVEIGEFSVEIRIDRLKGNLRNYNLEVELEDYYNEYFQFLIGVMYASANGISIQFHDKSDYFSLEIGKLSYALNDWDLMFTEDGPKGTPTLNVSLDLQNTTIVLPSGMTGKRGQQEWEIYNYLTNERDITIQKISLDVTLNKNGTVTATGNLNLPVGKAALTVDMSMDREFKSEPYFNMLQIDITNLSPEIKAYMEELIRVERALFRRKGGGYSLRMSGDLDNPRIH